MTMLRVAFFHKAVLLLVVMLQNCMGAAPTQIGVEEIIFASRQPGAGGHWYENFGYYAQDQNKKAYRGRGRLYRLNITGGELTVLLDDPDGSIRDPQVHYDGEKILFSYRPGGMEHFHLYEINIDGSRLRQLTSGPYDDIVPTYLPNGQIMFCSGRGDRWVPCWYSQVAILYICDGDGANIRPISANIEHDNTPWPLPDGRVIYERWEYVDRSRVAFHHLWTANPDGTGQMVFYGNLHPGTLMIDAKPIPDSDNEVLVVFSPEHGRKEHEGAITIVTAKPGIVIGRRGASINALKAKLETMPGMKGMNLRLDVVEVERPELDAHVVADDLRRSTRGPAQSVQDDDVCSRPHHAAGDGCRVVNGGYLDRDRLGIVSRLLECADKLGQVFDGVYLVLRRRR